MTPIDPFAPETFTLGGNQGVKACEGTVKGIFHGDRRDYYEKATNAGDIYVLERVDPMVTEHEDPAQVGPKTELNITYSVNTTKGKTWEKVFSAYKALGIRLTSDGSGLIGKRLAFVRTETSVWVDRDGKTQRAMPLLPTKILAVVGATAVSGAPAGAVAVPAASANGTNVLANVSDTDMALLLELAAGKTRAEIQRAAIMKAAIRKAGLGNAARDGTLATALVDAGILEEKDGRLAKPA